MYTYTKRPERAGLIQEWAITSPNSEAVFEWYTPWEEEVSRVVRLMNSAYLSGVAYGWENPNKARS